MINGKKIIALIPARGGSKGLPGKNIRPLLGKPLIAWTIEQAKSSKYLDTVVVSTDDAEIVSIAEEHGADPSIKRPKELAQDNSPTIDTIVHALDHFEEKGEKFNYLVLLEATSPLREVEDIDRCIELLTGNESAEAIVSVAKQEGSHPEFNMIIDDENGLIRKLNGSTEFNVIRRQALTDVYFLDGTVYMSKVDSIVKRRTFYHEQTMAYVVERWKSLEIDELTDFISAEALLSARIESLF